MTIGYRVTQLVAGLHFFTGKDNFICAVINTFFYSAYITCETFTDLKRAQTVT